MNVRACAAALVLLGASCASDLHAVDRTGPAPRAKADRSPAGLTRHDWSQIQSFFVHDAQLFGHGDPVGGGGYAGSSVSVSGDTAVVGAPFDTTAGGVFAGSAQVFVRSGTTWTVGPRLAASDGVGGDFFGTSVSVSGDTLVVGAPGGYAGASPVPGWAYVFVRSGTAWVQQQKLLASDGQVNDHFGTAVSISGDTVIVGAPLDDTAAGADAGSAYVFVRSANTWTEQQKLLASNAVAGAHLGSSASVDGDTALVGAAGSGPGSAYVFVRSGVTWTGQQALIASDGAAGDAFGNSVSISGDTAVIGAPNADSPGVDAGAAYVFVRSGTTWAEQQKLVASDPGAGDLFGFAVSISGETVVAGAPYHDPPGGANAGSAYVLVRSGAAWTEQQELTASDGLPQDFFGFAVSVYGDTAMVGAWLGDTPAGADTGTSYAFLRTGTTWSQQQELIGRDSGEFDNLGYSVSVSGDTVVIGAPQDTTTGGHYAGAVYVFVRSGSTWTEQQKLLASDGAADDYFGYTVSVDGDTAVVGARYDDTAAGVNAGSAYVFVRSGNTWSEQQKLLASDGAAFDVFGSSVSVSGDTVVVGAPSAGSLAGAAYVFVRSGTSWAQQQKFTPPPLLETLGYSVSISGDTIAVGAPEIFLGRVLVFTRTGTVWSLQAILSASPAGVPRFFGHAVSISGETLAASGPTEPTPGGNNAGAVYIFVRSGTTWSQQQRLVASDGGPEDRFGWSLSLSGETLVVGAPYGVSEVGGAYVFVRTGTTWTEQQKLVAPGAAAGDTFGYSAAVSVDTIVAGAPADDTAEGQNAGSVHVYRPHVADLGITKTDGQTSAAPGQPITYTITASNAGPDAVTGATVVDLPPPALLGAAWTCTASPGSTCSSSGTGGINDTVDLLVAGTVTYALTGTIDPAATGTLVNVATVTAPAGVPDPDPSNDSATDVDTLAPEADLGIAKTDSADPVSPGDPLTYALAITNAGPSDATSVTVSDSLPAGVTFVSSSPGPPGCTLAGATLTCNLGTVASGNTSTVSINVTVDPTAVGILVNNATVTGNEPDPDPTNNAASAATAVGRRDGELAHGTDALYDLAAQPGPVADDDVFRINQKPYSSYEVVVDATSGDIGAGSGPLLERIGPDGTTVVQTSVAIGIGPSRSLRWRNTTAAEVEGETIRVRSAGCGTDCGPDDVYRIRAYETTCSVPRFNNAGTQITVLVLQNPTSYAISGEVYFRISAGTLVAVQSFSLNPNATLVLNTAAVPGANGVSGAVTVAHNGRYGDLAGKTVALEPATGFSFDSPLVPRLR